MEWAFLLAACDRLIPSDDIGSGAQESGKLQLEDIGEKLFFSQLLAETRNGYFSHSLHGGNKNMGAWKMIGYPGMRADYLDWVNVRDRAYPLPPVDLSGKRG